MKQNYQIMLDNELKSIEKKGERPSLLLHACCAPCSSYVLEYLNKYFDITVFYYNPNISPKSEFEYRVNEVKRLIGELPHENNINFIEGEYDSNLFFDMAKGMENLPEGGERCFKCYELRLRRSAKEAKKGGFDYFTTTLSISPYKNAAKLNEIGASLSKEFGIKYLFSDFKKKNGYKRSCELSAVYGLYRQNYCGCVFSKRQSENN
jgi:predicted adenine nucleotide alpha hydrolase (AANH) superfamily ATPase